MQMELLLAADSSSQQSKSQTGLAADGSWSRTSPDCSARMQDATLLQWLESWLGSALTFRQMDGQMPVLLSAPKDSLSGRLWMRSIAEWTPILEPFLKDDDVCSLSEILEPSGSVGRQYFLSPRACAGILHRAGNRGKELPHQLRLALQEVARAAADGEPTSSPEEE